jgi:large subunit ribosomal protein L22
MSKSKTLPKFEQNQAGATAKYLHVPPRKARLVLDAVRGKYVSDALAILKFVPNNAARAIEDVINSAVANAQNSRPYSEETGKPLAPLIADNLKLLVAFVDEGPRIKRLQPRAQGRAYRILKRMCHISVILEETAPKPRPVRRQTDTRRARRTGAAAPATVTGARAEVQPELEAAKLTAALNAEEAKTEATGAAIAEENSSEKTKAE